MIQTQQPQQPQQMNTTKKLSPDKIAQIRREIQEETANLPINGEVSKNNNLNNNKKIKNKKNKQLEPLERQKQIEDKYFSKFYY